MLKYEMDSMRASHLLLTYCNSLLEFHSHLWGCENSALGLIHSHGKGCRRRRRHPTVAFVPPTAKMRADIQRHLPASFHSPTSLAKWGRGAICIYFTCFFLSRYVLPNRGTVLCSNVDSWIIDGSCITWAISLSTHYGERASQSSRQQ